ncbi:orphan sodium- and chloride-dependent neurotransmitter transporter NTT5 [Perognathus longimembris pacificus]|uniref:orphan sodium- and chloride-dependent neurotransmitter transporter NTT5 n=1 Tax=Perognathus longimembris pacificus TaxID=214514 RepID=UPI002018AE0C|nr:orphan sodium- and chloride-dependent neurotransmitter transporter NTT5 [Perognathus longimembris pacificus]
MGSLEDFSDAPEEESSKLHTSHSFSWNFKAKEVWANKSPNYVLRSRNREGILIQMAFSMWLGSMWRFPYLCHRNNGGGSFILLYLIMLLLFGVPLLYLEMLIGHWLQEDSIQIWKQLVPWMGGVGYSNILVSVLVSLHNSTIISWCLFYLSQSFVYPLPWSHCLMAKNSNTTDLSCLWTVPQQYFWYHTALRASDNIETGMNTMVFHLCLGVLTTWAFLFLIMTAEIKISMSILTSSIFLPYILLLCLLIRSVFLEGAFGSLKRMLTTELATLASMEVWYEAGSHVLYSLGLGLGTIMTLSQARYTNYIKAASSVAFVNLVTSLLITSIVFLVLGFWATTSGHTCVEMSVSSLTKFISKGILPQKARPPDDVLRRPPMDYLMWIMGLPKHLQHKVIQLSPSCSVMVKNEKFMQGLGLSFVAFSQAVSLLPGASFWAIIFFLALIIMELCIMIRILECITLTLQNFIFTKHPRMVPVVICLGGCLGSLIFSSCSGSYIVALLDDHTIPLVFIIVVLFQNVALAWIYGAQRFRQAILEKLGHLLRPLVTVLWSCVTPLWLLILLGVWLLDHYRGPSLSYITWNSSMSQEVRQPYQGWVLHCLTGLSILPLFVIFIYLLHHWWHLQDSTIPDAPERLPAKKMPAVLPKPLPWPKHPMKKSTTEPQDASSRSSEFSLPLRARSSSWFKTFLLPSSQDSLMTPLQVTPTSATLEDSPSTNRPPQATGSATPNAAPILQESKSTS